MLELNEVPSDGKEDCEVEKSEFYAVSIPSDFPCSDQPLVFTSKNDALSAIKKYVGARFMRFTSYEEAVEYGSKPLPSSPALLSNAEEKATFRSLTSQQMVSLRKTIETGDEVLFLNRVWSNPRYLINNAGDGPTILQEGTRYNALHIAAKFKKTNMCLTILNTIHNEEFISGLYPNEDSTMIKDRIKRLVDLYLNTPDKSLSETPLHFACKYGADEILSVFLSFPECDISRRNKYGILAKEMICDRAPDSLLLKEKMLLMFEDLFYIPILRDVANNIQRPVIGKPCLSNIVLEATSLTLASNFSYGKNNLVCCAFAGPMSQNAADNFYKVFSKKKFAEQLSFTPEQKRQLVDICLSDSEKGLERVGRTLAREFGIGWIEYWPKLNFWGDLSSAVGLEFLESYLKNQSEMINTSYSSLERETERNSFHNMVSKFIDEFVKKLPQLLNNKSEMTFFILFQSLLPYIFFMREFSFSEDKQLFHIHSEIGQLLYLKLIESNKKNFDSIKFYINTQFVYIHNFLNRLSCYGCEKWKMFLCILKYVCYSSNVLVLKTLVCDCNWIVKKDCYIYNSSLCYYSVIKLKQNFINYLASSKHLLKREMCTYTFADKVIKHSKNTLVTISPVPEKGVVDFEELASDQERSFNKFLDVSDSLCKYCDVGKILTSKFCIMFCSLILNYADSPFSTEQTFFDVFKQIIPFFKPLCQLNYSQDVTLTFHHSEVAIALLNKIHNDLTSISFDILNKWKTYFKNADIFNDRNIDVCKFDVANSREWIHLFCVIKYLCAFLDYYDHTVPLCGCQNESYCKCEFKRAIYCSDCLKGLQNMCEIMSDCQENLLLSDTLKSLSLETTEEEDEEFFTPPESPTFNKVEVYINGSEISDVDIDVFRAIVDGRSKISHFGYPNIFSWKCLMELKLGSLLKPEDKLSCTPSSSSASLRRTVKPKKDVRRTLF